MGKWRLFRRTITKDKESMNQENAESVDEQIFEEKTESEEDEERYAEYKETLYTEGTADTSNPDNVNTTNQRIWRDVSSIEKNIDNLKVSKTREPVSDLDKTVDKILSKVKKK